MYGGPLGSACAPAAVLRQVVVSGESTTTTEVRYHFAAGSARTVPYPVDDGWIRPRLKRSEVHILISALSRISRDVFRKPANGAL